ncbi:MAG TPA: TetR/AcrR family transcriptional regulator C-terminal domain-containing protein [Candidatus Enterocloster faecavium]|uniref:TetR/AcrR family transcriptional regulator C-terminal domain-containing protein n=1 Tax=Candidatus Enterocloster faecavium TaxID=2838560 RepID=A0A9D2L640_9FIRM|nr:TetR/AcrR family transcriptional regulator C-terminal domain-containing protein [Candidatus Enterocloster faecavium]
MDRTDLRIVKTHLQIDQALLDCLKDYPFQKITVDMLCKKALINRSTFYKYYLDKYDLLDKFLDKILEEFRRNIQVDFVNAAPSRIHDLCYIQSYESALKFIGSKKNDYEILWNAVIDRQIFNEMTRIVHDKIMDTLRPMARQTPVIEKYSALYAHLFASNMMSLVLWWFEYYDQISMEEVEEIMADNMRLGLFKTFRKKMES